MLTTKEILSIANFVLIIFVFLVLNLLISTVLTGESTNAISKLTTTITSKMTKPTQTPYSVDKFGIKEIYPTKIGGREWYVNMSSPESDKMFSISGDTKGERGSLTSNLSSLQNGTSSYLGNNSTKITKVREGSYQIIGERKAGEYNLAVRMNVNTPPVGVSPWKNVEMTGYIKVIAALTNSSSNDLSLEWYARGGNHTSDSPCQGVALHGGITLNGTVYWQKEIWHTGGYTDMRAKLGAITNSLLGRWIGFKVIMYNINNDSAVKMESYVDDKANNTWRKVIDTIDSGGWYAGSTNDKFYSANCGRSKDYIVLNSGPIATFRSNNVIWDFKDLSIREIRPPAVA